MSQTQVEIESRLQAAGYQTSRIGSEVQVHDPVNRIVGDSIIVDSWRLVEIRSGREAWEFIENRGIKE